MKHNSVFSIHTIMILLITTCLVIWVQPSWAKDKIVLENIRLANTRDDLLTYFTVKGAFTPKITQAVQEGIPTTFSFYVSIYKIKNFWKDQKIAGIEFSSTIVYNSLKKEYTVTRPWKDPKPSSTKSFEEARSWMTDIDNVQLVPLQKLIKGKKYQIRLQAEMDRTILPFYLHNVFFFLSFWDVKTDWYLINFTY